MDSVEWKCHGVCLEKSTGGEQPALFSREWFFLMRTEMEMLGADKPLSGAHQEWALFAGRTAVPSLKPQSFLHIDLNLLSWLWHCSRNVKKNLYSNLHEQKDPITRRICIAKECDSSE